MVEQSTNNSGTVASRLSGSQNFFGLGKKQDNKEQLKRRWLQYANEAEEAEVFKEDSSREQGTIHDHEGHKSVENISKDVLIATKEATLKSEQKTKEESKLHQEI